MRSASERMLHAVLGTLALLGLTAFGGPAARAQQDGRPPRVERPLPQGADPADAEYLGGTDGIDLATYINGSMADKHIAGLSAAIVKEGQIYWTGAFGFANPAESLPVVDETLFMLASVSKTVTATALMQLADQGLFALDDPINDQLPFAVVHPGYPGTDITFRMLLTHTSGITDNWGVMPYYPGDSTYALGTYLADYLVAGGALYNPAKSYLAWEPGTAFSYSNNAVALAGYLVEVLSGVPFDDYCATNVFAPLDMDETAWMLADLDPTHVAMPCAWNGSTWVGYGHYGYSDYPSGQLRTSATQLAQFLTMFIQDGQYGTETLLAASTAQQMKTPQVPGIEASQGLVWYTGTIGGRSVWGHNGGDQGVTTEMWFDPATGIGVVALTNSDAYFTNIVDALFDYAEEQPPLTSLVADTATVSIGAGSQVGFTLTGGSVNGGRPYVVLGGASGTSPGTPLPGGGVTLPVNWDAATELIIANINTPMFFNFYGTLSAQGVGRATFNTLGPLPPVVVGLSLHFAGAFLAPWDYVTNPAEIEFTP